MRKIHIEGMGILGGLLAIELERLGIDFTWHDTEEFINAWEACTGCVYPAGALDSDDMAGLRMWRNKLRNKAQEYAAIEFFERSAYTFNHKAPPHKGAYRMLTLRGWSLPVADVSSINFNAQEFVPWVRERFVSRRRKAAPTKCQLVQAHGFGARLTHYYWGWSALVKIKYDTDVFSRRPCFYFRDGRFIMAYAFPCPSTPFWFAGSSIIKQTSPKQLEIKVKYERWRSNFERLSRGTAKVTSLESLSEGWRPAGVSQEPACHWKGEVLQFPSLWNSGVRHAPLVIQDALNKLKLGDWL